MPSRPVQENFSACKAKLPSASHRDVMAALAQGWRTVGAAAGCSVTGDSDTFANDCDTEQQLCRDVALALRFADDDAEVPSTGP